MNLEEIKASGEKVVALSQEEWNWIKDRLIDRPYLIKIIAKQSKDNSAKDQQIATLEKTLKNVFSEFGRYLPHDMDYYIHQAQQTHETQEEER